MFSVLTTWQKGREIITHRRVEEEGPLRRFVDEVRDATPPVARAPGTAVFLNANPETTPLALRANVEHNHVLHECVLIVSLVTERVPYIHEDERLSIDDLGYSDDGITHITGRFGFQDSLDVPALLRLASAQGIEGNPKLDNPSYFVSRHHDHRRRQARDGEVAQEAVPGDLAQRRQPGRGLPPARRAHGRDGLAHRALRTDESARRPES